MSRKLQTATILISSTVSDRVYLEGVQASALLFPSAFDGATVSFQCPDGAGGYAAVATLTVAVSTSSWVQIPEATARTIGDDFKLVSASTETAERAILVRGV